MIFGGVTDPLRTAGESDEVWPLDHVSGAYSWRALAVASGGRTTPSSTAAPATSRRVPRLVVYGGVTRYFTRSELWELRFPPAP